MTGIACTTGSEIVSSAWAGLTGSEISVFCSVTSFFMSIGISADIRGVSLVSVSASAHDIETARGENVTE